MFCNVLNGEMLFALGAAHIFGFLGVAYVLSFRIRPLGLMTVPGADEHLCGVLVALSTSVFLLCLDVQLARVADRVRRMPLHSPLAAVLAGVELTLRKAQDWEQHAHRGVSLKDELRSLSALVVRWRAVELKSWPQLLDAREGAFVLKVCGRRVVS